MAAPDGGGRSLYSDSDMGTTFDVKKSALADVSGLENLDVTRGETAWDRLTVERTMLQ